MSFAGSPQSVTHVAGQLCYPCPRLLTQSFAAKSAGDPSVSDAILDKALQSDQVTP